MRRTTFAQVSVHARFFFDGVWYIKIDPLVKTVTVMVNAVRADNELQGFWFEDSDIVQQ